MADRTIDQYLGRLATTPDAKPVERESSGPAGEPGSAPRMLELVFRSGERLGLPYAYLLSAKLTTTGSIELVFTEHTVTITGRGLGVLYQHLVAQTARRVGESLGGFDAGSTEGWVSEIVVTPASDSERDPATKS